MSNQITQIRKYFIQEYEEDGWLICAAACFKLKDARDEIQILRYMNRSKKYRLVKQVKKLIVTEKVIK